MRAFFTQGETGAGGVRLGDLRGRGRRKAVRFRGARTCAGRAVSRLRCFCRVTGRGS